MKTPNRGGKRQGAGRKPDPVKKERITVHVPQKHKEEIREKVIKLAKAYEDKCRKEL
jgi:hypothetical protein